MSVSYPDCSIVDNVNRLLDIVNSMTIPTRSTLDSRAAAGIYAAQARVVPCDDQSVALIRRFDRSADGGRIFAVSAGTLMGVERGTPGDHTYAEMVDTMRSSTAQMMLSLRGLALIIGNHVISYP